MAHELFGSRFLDNRKPAWHRLGNVVTDPLSAEEAFDRVGAYDIVSVPLVPDLSGLDAATIESLTGFAVSQKALVRTATADASAKVLGTVGNDYEIVGPRAFVQAWDRAIDQPVETLGSLKSGGILFVSTHLGGYQLKGDPDEEGVDYLLAYNGMTGSDSIRFDVTRVRAVCQNTVNAAQAVASETLILPHSAAGLAEFESSLKDAFTRARYRVAAVQEACEILAGVKVDAEMIAEITAAVYPVPRTPNDFGPKLIVERRMQTFENNRTFALGSRDSVVELFNSAETCNTNTAHGTLWGLYNAVVEFEDYRSHKTNPHAVAEGAMIGKRADAKERAFVKALSIAQG